MNKNLITLTRSITVRNKRYDKGHQFKMLRKAKNSYLVEFGSGHFGQVGFDEAEIPA